MKGLRHGTSAWRLKVRWHRAVASTRARSSRHSARRVGGGPTRCRRRATEDPLQKTAAVFPSSRSSDRQRVAANRSFPLTPPPRWLGGRTPTVPPRSGESKRSFIEGIVVAIPQLVSGSHRWSTTSKQITTTRRRRSLPNPNDKIPNGITPDATGAHTKPAYPIYCCTGGRVPHPISTPATAGEEGGRGLSARRRKNQRRKREGTRAEYGNVKWFVV